MVSDRAFCQIKTFCDKGAERKAREEERRLSRQQLSAGFALSVQPRSVFQHAFDLVTEPIFFTPKARPLPPMTPPSLLAAPSATVSSDQLALPAPGDCSSPSAATAAATGAATVRLSAPSTAGPSAGKRVGNPAARASRGALHHLRLDLAWPAHGPLPGLCGPLCQTCWMRDEGWCKNCWQQWATSAT